MKNEKTKIFSGIIIVSFIIAVLLFFILRSVFMKNEVDKSQNYIIAKFVSKDIGPKSTFFYFTYFVDKKKIVSANVGIAYSILNSESETKQIDNLKINSFYLAKFNPEYPDVIIVNPEKEVTDTVAIIKAGFPVKDVKNIKQN